VLYSFAGLLRLASLVICLTVLTSFAIFAIDQTSKASTHQQEELNGAAPATAASAATAGTSTTARAHKSALHSAIDNASNDLTSPFSSISPSSGSQWASHGVNLLLALIVYGFGLGFLARTIRVRV
jgi:hypothetical protein